MASLSDLARILNAAQQGDPTAEQLALISGPLSLLAMICRIGKQGPVK